MPSLIRPLPSFPSVFPGRRRSAAARRRAGIALVLAIGIPAACRRAPTALSSGTNSETATTAPARERPLPAARASSAGYLLTPAESGAVDDFLRRNPNLRPATDADRKPGSDADAELRSLYGVYHPYFVRGDLNDDGVLDFVLAFVRRDLGRETPWFSVVVFTGRTTPGASSDFSSGLFVERDVTLAHGDVSVDRDSIVISPDLDDDTIRRYRWDPPSHTFVFVQADGDDPDRRPLSQTSRRADAGPPPVGF